MDMEKEIYGYIYKIRNTVNDKVYIGLTTNGFDRRYDAYGKGIERVYNYHVQRRKNGYFYNIHLLNSIEKYGFEAFEVVKEFDIAYSIEELKEKEKYWIGYYKSNDVNYGYNRTEGGDSFLSGKDSPLYKERVTFKCAYCGKEVERLESYKNHVSNIFCSKECSAKWKSENLRGKNSPNYKPRAIFKCACCGKEVEILESRKKYVSNVFCSKECLKKWQSEQRKGKTKGKTKGKDNLLYKGFVTIYPSGEVSKEMTRNEMASFLGVCEDIIKDLAREKTCYIGKYENIRYIRVLHLEDYLKEIEDKSDKEFRDMCKRKIKEAEILYQNKKEELKKKKSEAQKGKKRSEETRKNIGESRKGKFGGIKSSQAKLVVAIFPDGRIIKDVCMKELAEELKIDRQLVRKILNSEDPYEAPNRSDKSYLKQLDGVIIMYQEDYLHMIENSNINDNKAS